MWALAAAFSAVFAALTTLLAKIGLSGVNSTLATAIRTAVVLVMSWGMVFIVGAQRGISELTQKNWLFLILSGIATGLSWLCYFYAVKVGNVSKVVPIDKMSAVITVVLAILLFKEPFTAKTIVGLVLVAGGTLLMI